MVGVIERAAAYRLDGRWPLPAPARMSCLAGLGREIVHFIVQEKSQTLGRHLAAVTAVEGVGDQGDVALASAML